MTLPSPCDLCGTTDSLDIPGDPSGKIRICKGCGLVHVKERRSLSEVAAAWSDIYKNRGYDPEWPGVKARLFYVAEWLDQTIGLRGKSVLDIGAGNGQFLAYCHDRGADPIGLDPDHGNVAKINARGITCIDGWAADDKLAPEGQFDIVTLNWTLENTADCLAVLRYAKRCLAPGGHVVVSTGSRILMPFKKSLRFYLPQAIDYPHDTHCYRWSDNSIKRAFQSAGLGYKKGWNDYFNRDEMICVAVHGGETAETNDDPQLVKEFFQDWQACFP